MKSQNQGANKYKLSLSRPNLLPNGSGQTPLNEENDKLGHTRKTLEVTDD
jgi:hypothetical protein